MHRGISEQQDIDTGGMNPGSGDRSFEERLRESVIIEKDQLESSCTSDPSSGRDEYSTFRATPDRQV